MGVKDLKEALFGPPGAIDGYLESTKDDEVRADILALTGIGQPGPREADIRENRQLLPNWDVEVCRDMNTPPSPRCRDYVRGYRGHQG
jgi:hypothetical protein